MDRLTYQDINLTDNEKRKQLIQLYKAGNYEAALQTLQETSLDNKHITAQIINDITDAVVALEVNLDPAFKQDIIITSPQPPIGIKKGEVWFEQGKPYIWREVNQLAYTFNNINALGYTWTEINRGGW